MIVQTHTPVEAMRLQTQFRWYADPAIPRLLVSYVVGNWISQWQEDIDVWENKVFLQKPFLVKGDGPMMKLRRWYKQFYSEGSYKVQKKHVPAAQDW